MCVKLSRGSALLVLQFTQGSGCSAVSFCSELITVSHPSFHVASLLYSLLQKENHSQKKKCTSLFMFILISIFCRLPPLLLCGLSYFPVWSYEVLSTSQKHIDPSHSYLCKWKGVKNTWPTVKPTRAYCTLAEVTQTQLCLEFTVCSVLCMQEATRNIECYGENQPSLHNLLYFQTSLLLFLQTFTCMVVVVVTCESACCTSGDWFSLDSLHGATSSPPGPHSDEPYYNTVVMSTTFSTFYFLPEVKQAKECCMS